MLVEDHLDGGVQVPFADYGTVSFSGLRASLRDSVIVSTSSPPANGGFTLTYSG